MSVFMICFYYIMLYILILRRLNKRTAFIITLYHFVFLNPLDIIPNYNNISLLRCATVSLSLGQCWALILYLTHWAKMKCILIIPLTQRANMWSCDHGETAVTLLISHCHKCLNTSRSLWAATTRPTRWEKGPKKSEKYKIEGLKESENTKERHIKGVVNYPFLCCGPFFIQHLWPSAKACTVPLTGRHGGRGWIAMDGFERGGPKRRAVCSICAHCVAFRNCQKVQKLSLRMIQQWDFHDSWMVRTCFIL